MENAYKLPSIRKNNKRYNPSFNLFDRTYIPNNTSEILLSSLKNLDLRKLVKKDIIKQIENDETNNFNFYDIPMFAPQDESEKLKEVQKFKSIHNNIDLQNKNFLSKIFTKPEYNDIETKVRKSLKRSGSILMLNEMFFELEKHHPENDPKSIDLSLAIKRSVTDTDYESESNVISNLDKWIKKAKIYQENKNNNKSYFPNIQKRKKFVNEETKQNEKERIEEEILKKYDKEVDENLKVKVKKIEDYEIQAFLKKMPKINKMTTIFFESEDKKLAEEINENFIINLKKNVKTLLRANIANNNAVEMADFFEKNVSILEEKIEHKLKNLDALLVTKQRTMQLIRKENIHILERMNKIKELKVTLAKTSRSSDKTGETMKNRISQNSKENEKNMKKIEEYNKGSNPLTKQVQEFKEKEELKRNCDLLKDNWSAYEAKLEYNKKMINDIEPSKKSIKDDIRHIMKIRRKFLIKLLKLGKDFRNEGLAWLIKRCWSVGEKINEINLPDFLDEKSKEFLLNKAKYEKNIKEYELFSKISVEVLKANVIEDKNDNKNLIKENDFTKNTEDSIQTKMDLELSTGSLFLTKPPNKKEKKSDIEKIFEENFSIEVKKPPKEKIKFEDKLKDLVYKRVKDSINFAPHSKNSFSDIVYDETRKMIKELIRPNYESDNPNEKTHFEELSTLTFDVNYSENFTQNVLLYENDSKCHYHTNRNDFLKDVEILNKKIHDTQKLIISLQNTEIYRIIKEFDYRNYAKRFSTDVTRVLACLIGVRQALKEVSKFGMGNKAYIIN